MWAAKIKLAAYYTCGNLPQHKNQTVALKLTNVPTAMDKHKITYELWETVIPMRFKPKL
jgi:hypothetical protein